MKKQKVLFVVEAMGGGVRRHIVDLINWLDKEKFEIMLLYGEKRVDDSFKYSITNLSKIATLKKSSYLVREIDIKADIKAIKETKQVIKEFKPDIIHCHSSKAGVIGRYAAKRLGVKKIYYTPHAYSFQKNNFSRKKRLLFIKIERWLSKHATTMTFNVSNGEKNEALRNNIDSFDKFKVIYNGISDYNKNDSYSIKSELGLDEDCLIVGVTSRLDSQKEPFVFVKIAKMVIEKIPNTHFVYVGDGPLFNEIKKYVFDNDIDKNVHLLGFSNDVQSIVKDFDLFLFTSLNESMPYCLIESLCAGVPIAATKVMGNDEVVIPGLNGELFEASNIQKGCETVCNMLYNKDKYSYQKIRSDFMNRFLIDKMINAIQGVYLDNY